MNITTKQLSHTSLWQRYKLAEFLNILSRVQINNFLAISLVPNGLKSLTSAELLKMLSNLHLMDLYWCKRAW